MPGDLSKYDVFHSELLHGARYAGDLELPVLKACAKTPNKLVSFSKAVGFRRKSYAQWVMFYEHDVNFERIWNNPSRYLKTLQKYRGVIGPDFSMYRNMPEVMQQWNCFRGRAICHWLQENGVDVIPNARFSDERSLEWCFLGLPKNATIAIGTLGCSKGECNRELLGFGTARLIEELKPKTLVVYGPTPDEVALPAKNANVPVLRFETEISKAFGK